MIGRGSPRVGASTTKGSPKGNQSKPKHEAYSARMGYPSRRKAIFEGPIKSPWPPETVGVDVNPTPTGINEVDAVLAERGSRYGVFKDHARITQLLKETMRQQPGWWRLSPSQMEALEMVAHKIGRILNGDPNYLDSWVDIEGYARLIVKELQGEPV